jgi:ribosomal protein S18 acetylase RimI-like enzyme
MVGQVIKQSEMPFHGARPFEPARDLGGVAHLLEEAFRSEHTFPLSDSPLLRELGVFLWTLSYAPVFPENISGFVWVEDRRIVGNVTLSLDEARLDRYLISNVAVLPSYRRRGIARALMQASLDHLRARGAKWALLNVRPGNPGAIRLYQSLGFREIEMRGEWRLASSATSALPYTSKAELWNRGVASDGLVLRSLRSSDYRTATALIRAATPAEVQQFRLPYTKEFRLGWEDRATEAMVDFFTGQVTRRRVLEHSGQLAALLMVRGQRLASPHRIAVEVQPDYRGRVEADLLSCALHDLARFPPRLVHIQAASTHRELVAALEQAGFTFLNGLTLMALAL